MISVIAAMSENRVIGKNGELPWHMPADLAHFKKLTLGNVVVMGRKTAESIFQKIGKSLPLRHNIVLTNNPGASFEKCSIMRSFEEVLKFDENLGEMEFFYPWRDRGPERELFIIGGEDVYRQALPHAKKLYLTIIHADFKGDAFFPVDLGNRWLVQIEKRDFSPDEKNLYPYSFIVYEIKP